MGVFTRQDERFMRFFLRREELTLSHQRLCCHVSVCACAVYANLNLIKLCDYLRVVLRARCKT